MDLSWSRFPFPEEECTTSDPVSLTTEQVDAIDNSLERAMAVLDLLVGCGPDEIPWKEMPSPGSLTVLFMYRKNNIAIKS